MSQRVMFALLTLAGAMYPKTAAGQRPAELAFADPQPHFVASWAPKKAREACSECLWSWPMFRSILPSRP
jgi:hypothetical protein